MAEVEHRLAGRVAAANVPHIVSFCRCGLGFWGKDTDEADARWEEHRNGTEEARDAEAEARHEGLYQPAPPDPDSRWA